MLLLSWARAQEQAGLADGERGSVTPQASPRTREENHRCTDLASKLFTVSSQGTSEITPVIGTKH